MATDQRTSTSHTATRPASARTRGRLTGGGTEGNERLTAATGAILILLLAVIGVTIVRLRPLLSVHLFVGLLLIPPVLLKLASTGYRFMRYYTHNEAYRRKGPPEAVLRIIAPAVAISTIAVLASGVALLLVGPSASSRQTLFQVHKLSFFVWAAFTALHVLGHLTELPGALRADYTPSARLTSDVTGRSGRALSLAGALVAGAVLAIVLIPEFGLWLHGVGVFHHH